MSILDYQTTMPPLLKFLTELGCLNKNGIIRLMTDMPRLTTDNYPSLSKNSKNIEDR